MNEKITSSTRRGRVLNLMSDYGWHSTVDICAVDVGGTEGCRRLRELRAKGYTIAKRKKIDSTQYEYKLVTRFRREPQLAEASQR